MGGAVSRVIGARRLILHTEAGYIYADYFSFLSVLLAFRRRTIHLHL